MNLGGPSSVVLRPLGSPRGRRITVSVTTAMSFATEPLSCGGY
jgi:hypothetical protein